VKNTLHNRTWDVEEMKTLDALDIQLKNRAGDLENLKAEGHNIIGTYPGGYVPEEIILACDAGQGRHHHCRKKRRTELSRGLYHSTSALLNWTKRAVEDFDLDGILWSQPIHCRPMSSSGFILKKAIEKECGIPVLILEADWYDNRVISGETMWTKIETFGHLLAVKKAKGKTMN